ncbi:MAG: IS66 family transposase, partial [Parabacteroides sp.]|nr:IS66 family transposase [Parabacteroides sp.]
RRNWLHTGSHFAAQNIAFMFGLLESCKLNNINFGEYIEDILTRFMFGKQADESFLPCNYEPLNTERTDVA